MANSSTPGRRRTIDEFTRRKRRIRKPRCKYAWHLVAWFRLSELLRMPVWDIWDRRVELHVR